MKVLIIEIFYDDSGYNYKVYLCNHGFTNYMKSIFMVMITIPEILDYVLVVAIMASSLTPEWKVFTAPDWDWRQFQEYSLILYFMCASANSHKFLTSIMNKWFTGKDFKDRHYGKKFFEEMEQIFGGEPGGWYRPSRIRKNIELLKPVNKWCLEKRIERGYPCFNTSTEEGLKGAKEFLATLPNEFKTVNIIYKIRELPGWIKMDSPDMRKEVVYLMSHLLMTEYGERLVNNTRYLYDLDQYLPWCVAVDRIYYNMPVQYEMGFFNYCMKSFKKKPMKKAYSRWWSTVSLRYS